MVKVIENNRTRLSCQFFGSPIPTLRWFKDGQGNNLYGGNYIIHDNGTLELRRARKVDEGTYTCVATNILGKAENRVRLEVKAALEKVVVVVIVTRMKKDDDSLTIINVSERDEGIYTCIASTELDSDSAKARLTVLGCQNVLNHNKTALWEKYKLYCY
eukprot:g36786.t1